jgi:hypothetical protein
LFIKKLQGYTSIEDYLDSHPAISLVEKNKILTLAVRKHFNTIGVDDILKENKLGQWLYKGKLISDGEKKLLISEATQLVSMHTWKILQDDIRYQATKKMFLLGQSEIYIITGKIWLYTLDAIKTRLNTMSSGIGNFNNK